MRRTVPLAVWLVLVWVALWGELTVANVLGGAAVALALIAAFPTAGPRSGLPVRLLPALRFAGYFVVKLVEANVVVAWEVVTPRNRINEGIVQVPLRQASDALTTLVANAVTLTPGTLTLEVERAPGGICVLSVHVLHLHSVEAVRRDILTLEYLAVQAFGDREARLAVVDAPRGTRPSEGSSPR
jgi:multicomponent Na+:H+ antiporter subunit E